MRSRLIITLTLAFIPALLWLPVTGAASSGDNVRTVLDTLEQQLSWLEYRLAQERWLLMTTGRSDSLEYFESMSQWLMSRRSTFDALHNARDRLSDKTDQRRYDLLYLPVLKGYVDSRGQLSRIYRLLVEQYSQDVCLIEGELRSTDLVRQILARDGQRINREHAYRALNSPDNTTVEMVARLFRLRNQEARRLGYNNYFTLSMSQVDSECLAYRELLHKVDSITSPAYQRLLDAFRAESNDLEPWNWYSRYLSTLNEADRYFPVDSQMVFVRSSMAGMGFNLNNLPIYFHLTSDTDRPASAHVLAIAIPHDVRVVANLTNGLISTRRLLRAVGLAVSLTETTEKSSLFARISDPAWSIAVGRFFELLCYEPDWLQTYAHLPANTARHLVEALVANDLMNTRELLVYMEFEYEAYQNPNRDLNDLYWDLYTEHTGLSRYDDMAPWVAKSELTTEPMHFRNVLLGRIAASQLMNSLNDSYGSVIDNAEVRSFMVYNFFRFGNRYDWTELMERATGKALNPGHLVAD